MGEHDAKRIFEELKEEHLRALKAGDIEALEKVQRKLDKLTAGHQSNRGQRRVAF